ncbi:cytochrome c and c1 heme-lyase [Rhizoclosmatium globosum]|uniref:Holocytochrome c-type synthase n=1 Tax=Rhizoclosmatium globosum TaxID=329046 RepID=A0A1Y2CMT0_9FUNG|nr:cytochrome c and c1 heme-lyase [Rhizoclosmatium globosum]|eukprot:ORY48313.1 cytochrome c and c1 heme-lyase [Rhizoclosmatium globosum]
MQQPALDNPLNNMPITPNQTPAKDQKAPLSIDREISTIPMAGKHDGKNWVYPSEQMFYNAMKRKNWNPEERDMGVVVPIHNAVNEQCWRKILEWEGMHKTACGQPKLLKFIGKPRDYTPKARILNLLGYKLPFDRHDWYIDRCGKEVRYVIDFYGGSQSPEEKGVSFFLDVRPAVSWDGIKDRVRKFWETGSGLF